MSGGPNWSRRAADAVAGFTSTRSKGMDALFGGPGGPSHAVRSQGTRVWSADGQELLDWTMALGAVGLGYAHPAVTAAVSEAVAAGAVQPLPPIAEVEVAELLCDAYPGAQQVRFFKTGAEAVAAAVRVARVATGRENIVRCGYHGWLDGATAGPGVPVSAAALWHEVPFGDVSALRDACHRHMPAAVVLEPLIERAPPHEWLAAARETAESCGAVLVLDEIKTAFRLARGGAAERWGVTPDLAVLGKALANGFPLSALVGRADLMARVRDTWISSTLATEAVSLAAARAVLQVWASQDVNGALGATGRSVMDGLSALATRGEPFSVEGVPEMFFLRFGNADVERRFLLGCASRGVLMKRGPYCFPCLAHSPQDVELTLRMAAESLGEALA